MLDKRDVHPIFQDRLAQLLSAYEGRPAAFARSIGIDRSALTQLLNPQASRLPRAETLHRIALNHGVSVDWLLGLSQAEMQRTEIAPTLEIEEAPVGEEETQLARWHREAIGTKIRYVPSRVPDLLRTEELIAFEHERGFGPKANTQVWEAATRIDYNRRPETDMEVCMPVQTLEHLANGEGIWAALSSDVRTAQLNHMARLVDELYPTFRMFLFDGREAFSAPYTVFGPERAAIYMGDMYFVLNRTDHIAALTRHFDGLIRKASVNPHEAAEHIGKLTA
ncbi:MAG: helix-turn-helix transcriptional regulator [Pseudomonadota bacterium]